MWFSIAVVGASNEPRKSWLLDGQESLRRRLSRSNIPVNPDRVDYNLFWLRYYVNVTAENITITPYAVVYSYKWRPRLLESGFTLNQREGMCSVYANETCKYCSCCTALARWRKNWSLLRGYGPLYRLGRNSLTWKVSRILLFRVYYLRCGVVVSEIMNDYNAITIPKSKEVAESLLTFVVSIHMIREIDLNPIFLNETCAIVVDASINPCIFSSWIVALA